MKRVYLGPLALQLTAGASLSRRHLLGLDAGDQTNSFPLITTGCYATVADGGWGYCGPAFCKDEYLTCAELPSVDGVTGTYETGRTAASCLPFMTNDDGFSTTWTLAGQCDSTCTQVTTGVCSSTFLNMVMKGDGVKYAYCNDGWLVIHSDGTPGVFTANLDDIPAPPKDGTGSFVTGMDSLSANKLSAVYIPLNPTMLSTTSADDDINKNIFDGGAGDGTYMYLSNNEQSFGLPSAAGIGIGVNGQSFYPIYNNRAVYNQNACELDSCAEHVGQGGGQPHLHGDPFGDEINTQCLYGPSDYTSAAGVQSTAEHPPIIGFSFDGVLIYGRYLHQAAPGYASPSLDACGGHIHEEEEVDKYGINLGTTYHYHTQIFDETTNGETYTVSSTGPFQCWKGDLSASTGSSALNTATASSSYLGKNDMGHFCCDMTEYYKDDSASDWPSGAISGDSSSTTTDSTTTGGTCSGVDEGGKDCPPTYTSSQPCPPGCTIDDDTSDTSTVTTAEPTAEPTAQPTLDPTPLPTATEVAATTTSTSGTCTGRTIRNKKCPNAYTAARPCPNGCTSVPYGDNFRLGVESDSEDEMACFNSVTGEPCVSGRRLLFGAEGSCECY